MSAKALTRQTLVPPVFDDFFRPFSQWFDDSSFVRRVASMPAVNIRENDDHYQLSIATPGLKKEDFHIDVENNTLTISSEKEEEKEEQETRFTRREYSYTSFSRSFGLPDDVKQDAIDAHYENGDLRITLPRKDEAKKAAMSKRIAVK